MIKKSCDKCFHYKVCKFYTGDPTKAGDCTFHSPKCNLPEGIDEIKLGKHTFSPCVHEDVEKHLNVDVTVEQCVNCGAVDISWRSNEGSEHLYADSEGNFTHEKPKNRSEYLE